MNRAHDDTANVAVGEGVLVLRRRGRSAVTAAILGEQLDGEGKMKTLWLDRLIHENHESTLGGNPVWGAVVTEIQVPVSCK